MTSNSYALHQQLKTSTHQIHQQLHHNPLLIQLTSRNCSQADYVTVLKIFYQFYLGCEHDFSAFAKPRFIDEAPALLWLDRDLNHFGQQPKINLNFAPATPIFLETYLGYLYVKQGSTLGGQVICRALQKSLNLTQANGLAFFSGFGNRTRELWQEFLVYLQAHEQDVDGNAVVASACRHFSILQKLLNAATATEATIYA